MKLPPYLSAVLASVLLTGAAAPIIVPQQPPPAPGRKPPPSAPPRTATLPPMAVRPNSSQPNMTQIPKSFLVSGLERQGSQTFFTGPNGGIVMGPETIRIVPCDAALAAASPGAPAGVAFPTVQRR